MSNIHNHYTEVLKCTVQSANNLDDILPLLNIASIQQIQKFLMDAITKLNVNATRKAYFNTLSIMDSLPHDIMQYVESFISDPNLIIINKRWNEFHNKNFTRLRKQAINSVPFQVTITCNSSLNIFPHYGACHDPMDEVDINRALLKCKPRATLFLHRGIHDIDYLKLERDVQFIGLGDDVKLTSHSGDNIKLREFVRLSVGTHASFENIIFDFPDHIAFEGIISLKAGAKMWLKNCTINSGCLGIDVGADADLHVQQCRFQGGSTGISVCPIARALTVGNSTFTDLGHVPHESQILDSASCSCIEIEDPTGKIDGGNLESRVRVQCIGNIFKNNQSLPIAESHEDSDEKCFLINTNSFEVKYNRIYNQGQIKGRIRSPSSISGWSKPPDYIDHNKIYYIVRKYKD
eukprot:196849_1